MNSLMNLMTMVGVQKTLIIACGDYGLNRHLEYNDRVFIYFLPDKMLQQHDALEKGRIQHCIESKECTQIVFVGTLHESLISRLKYGDAFQSLRATLRFNVRLWINNREGRMMSTALHNQLLVEQHVITQCRLLMDYYFIRERVEKRQIQVRGLVGELQDEYIKAIFHNGIIYNDVVSMS